ncbi:MAG: Gfo/Idh/MocA family protein, partial [Amnibacterium sp.]
THLALTERALEAGKHVLLEKPLARSVADGEALVRLADRGPGLLMVAHVVRFFAGYAALRDLVSAGRIGEVRAARAQRLSAAGGRPPWLDDEERSGGILLDLAIHDFDQLLLVLGPAGAVTVTASPDGTVTAAVEHAAGRSGPVRVGWDLPAGTPFTTVLDVEGDAGRATYTFQGEPADRSELAVEDATGRRLEAVPPGAPYAAQAAAFLEAVRSGVPPRQGGAAESLAAQRLALAARTSLVEGRRVELAP